MYICYENIDKKIMNIPQDQCWEIVYKPFDDEGDFDGGLYLIINDNVYLMRDIDYWCMGRDNLPCGAVEQLYLEMLDVIGEMLVGDAPVINICKIENMLIENKYKQLWLEKEYITIDDNGWW